MSIESLRRALYRVAGYEVPPTVCEHNLEPLPQQMGECPFQVETQGDHVYRCGCCASCRRECAEHPAP